MSTSVWDMPDMKVGGEFVKFEKIGDAVAGTVTAVRPHKFDDGSVVPQVLLTTDDGEERTVTCGAIRLKAAMAELRPEAGDHISIELESEEKRAGGKTLRHWKVDVRRAGVPAATPAPVAAPAPVVAPAATPGVDPQAVAAALAGLSPEQKAALGL